MTAPTTTALERREAPAVAAPGLDLARRDPLALGKVLAASGMFKDATDENQAAVKVIAGLELGIGSIPAMTGIHLIEGKPVVGANVMATLVKRHPRYDYRVVEHTDRVCSIDFLERDPAAAGGWRLAGNSTFTWDDAVRAEVAGKKNWKKHPKNMLFARALSDGVKFYAPDVTAGAPVYTPDELDVTIDEEVGDVAADVPPAAPPTSVARDRTAKPTSKPAAETEKLITAAQRRKLFAEANTAGVTEPELKALVLWVADVAHSDRIPRSRVDDMLAAVADHEAVLAVIHDKAADGDEVAEQIAQRFLGGDGASDPGPEGDGQQELV